MDVPRQDAVAAHQTVARARGTLDVAARRRAPRTRRRRPAPPGSRSRIRARSGIARTCTDGTAWRWARTRWRAWSAGAKRDASAPQRDDHARRAQRGGDVRDAGVVADEQARVADQRRELAQRRALAQVDRALARGPRDRRGKARPRPAAGDDDAGGLRRRACAATAPKRAAGQRREAAAPPDARRRNAPGTQAVLAPAASPPGALVGREREFERHALRWQAEEVDQREAALDLRAPLRPGQKRCGSGHQPCRGEEAAVARAPSRKASGLVTSPLPCICSTRSKRCACIAARNVGETGEIRRALGQRRIAGEGDEARRRDGRSDARTPRPTAGRSA